MPINKRLQHTFEILKKDADSILKLESAFDNHSHFSEAEEDNHKRNIILWYLHILDYLVSASLIDMDMEADIMRLCRRNPQEAKQFSSVLKEVWLVLKSNYQRLLLKEESLERIKMLYSGSIIWKLRGWSNSPIDINPDDIQFINFEGEENILESKLQLIETVKFEIPSIKQFIDKCLEWSKKIIDVLSIAYGNRTELVIADPYLLIKLYLKFKEDYKGHSSKIISEEEFCAIILNNKATIYTYASLPHKEHFYAIIFAIYNYSGDLWPRDKWRDEVFDSLHLVSTNNYRSAVTKITKHKDTPLSIYYDEIVNLLSSPLKTTNPKR